MRPLARMLPPAVRCAPTMTLPAESPSRAPMATTPACELLADTSQDATSAVELDAAGRPLLAQVPTAVRDATQHGADAAAAFVSVPPRRRPLGRLSRSDFYWMWAGWCCPSALPDAR